MSGWESVSTPFYIRSRVQCLVMKCVGEGRKDKLNTVAWDPSGNGKGTGRERGGERGREREEEENGIRAKVCAKIWRWRWRPWPPPTW